MCAVSVWQQAMPPDFAWEWQKLQPQYPWLCSGCDLLQVGMGSVAPGRQRAGDTAGSFIAHGVDGLPHAGIRVLVDLWTRHPGDSMVLVDPFQPRILRDSVGPQ